MVFQDIDVQTARYVSFAVFSYGAYIYPLYVFVLYQAVEFVYSEALELVLRFGAACHETYQTDNYEEKEIKRFDHKLNRLIDV